MPTFDPTTLGSQLRAFDGSNAKVKIDAVDAPSRSVKSITAAFTVEGKEHQYALGERKAFAKTEGIIKPGESTIMVYAGALPAFLKAWEPGGAFLDIPRDIRLTFDEKSKPGLAAILSALKLDTMTVNLLQCDIIGISSNIETGGAAIMAEVKVLPLDIEWAGFAGSAPGFTINF